MPNVKPIPDGYHTVQVYLVVNDAAAAIDYYKRAFGAKENMRMPAPDGKKIIHAEIRIGDSVVMLSDELPEMNVKSPKTLGGTGTGVFLYVEDTDKTYKSALTAGGKEIMAPTDQFWGDRYAKLSDPFGHEWSIATHIEDVSPAEMKNRQEKFAAQMKANAHV